MPNVIPKLDEPDPITFDPDGNGTVHAYAPFVTRGAPFIATACGVLLSPAHTVVEPSDTRPLCTECFA